MSSVLVALLLVYVISLYRGQGEADARTLTFTALIISNLALIVTSGRLASQRLKDAKTKPSSIPSPPLPWGYLIFKMIHRFWEIIRITHP
ncbi:MAG: hypothetical protein H7222_00395 [Methylotenera sp.]|nr:hypothetical protein [Oligoflexia bacterium]